MHGEAASKVHPEVSPSSAVVYSSVVASRTQYHDSEVILPVTNRAEKLPLPARLNLPVLLWADINMRQFISEGSGVEACGADDAYSYHLSPDFSVPRLWGSCR